VHATRKKKTAERERPLVPSSFWSPLVAADSLRPGHAFPDALTIPAQRRDVHYQPLEVLVVETFRVVCPEFQWEATRAGNDRGADFIGCGATVPIVPMHCTLYWIVVGQVKRASRPTVALFESGLKSLGRWLRKAPASNLFPADIGTSPVSTVLFVVSTEKKSKLATIREQLRDPYTAVGFTGQTHVISTDRLLTYWAARPDWFERMLKQALSPAVLSDLLAQLALVPRTSGPVLEISVRTPAQAFAGRPIRCILHVQAREPFPVNRYSIRYRQAGGPGDPMHVVRPSLLASDEGVSSSVAAGDTTRFEFWLRCFAPGRRDLGVIQLIDESGTLSTEENLGAVEIEPSFEAPYFSLPHREELAWANDRLKTAAADRQVVAFAVTGAGGAGKSRLCQEILDLAADHGFEWTSSRQDNAPTLGRPLIRRVMAVLSATDDDRIDDASHVIARVRRTVAPASAELVAAIETYFRENQGEVAVDHIAAALASLLAVRMRQRPVILHLHDLHWAGAELFTILRLALDYLRMSERKLPHGLVVMFEGRNQEALKSESGDYRPPDEWLRFLSGVGLPERRVRSWTGKECHEYLVSSIRAGIAPEDKVDPERVPLYEELINYVIRFAGGNPMHVIEQLKRMHALGIIKHHERGFLYVASWLPEDFATPEDILELIRARLALYRVRSPLIVDVLVLFAKIGRVISRALYDQLIEAAAITNVETTLHDIDIVSVPRGYDAAIEFVHENYFRALREERLPPDSSLLALAREWYEGQQLTAHQKAELARLLFLAPRPDYGRLLEIMRDALDDAREMHDGRLSEDLLRNLLRVPAGYRTDPSVADVPLEWELANVLTQVSSWEDALAHLDRLAKDAWARRSDPLLLLYWVKAKAEAANIYVSLQRPDDAVKAVEAALPLAEAAMTSAPPAVRDALMTQIEKLWHRKAVALWYDGRANEALPLQRRAFTFARARGDRKELSVTLREMGTILYHHHPHLGVRLMERSLAVGREANIYYSGILLAEAQVLMGQMLAAISTTSAHEVMKMALAAGRALHHQCMLRFTIYEAVLAALVAGSASAWLNELNESHVWFRSAAAMSVQARLQDEAWKSRLNLAQVAFEGGMRTEVEINAREAVKIIAEGLSVNPSMRAARRSLMTLPLLHALRMDAVRPSDIRAYVDAAQMQWLADWSGRPSFLTPRRQPQQVLHVRRDDFDYFLLN
jgi:tetratricopeptide (TPR) repeat protein